MLELGHKEICNILKYLEEKMDKSKQDGKFQQGNRSYKKIQMEL
jgi:hypothetical protein